MTSDTMGDADAIVTAAQALGAKIRAAGDEIEQARRLPLHIVEELRRIGAFRMPMPREWGGPELDPLAQVRVIEALSHADGSVGWCVMIGSDGGFFTAFLDQAVAREMYSDLDAATGGSLVFSGRAEIARDGYRVTGTWPFVSGCQHCQWIVTTCLVFENGAPRKLANGMPEAIEDHHQRVRASRVERHAFPSWYQTGASVAFIARRMRCVHTRGSTPQTRRGVGVR